MSDAPPRPARRHRIVVHDSENVVLRGTRRVEWSLRVNDGWIKAHDARGAEVESLNAPSGTVWERRITLELPTGARLLRVEVRPAREERRDALEYLTGKARTKTTRLRAVFRVTARGALERVPA